jgi:hypothetical protein
MAESPKAKENSPKGQVTHLTCDRVSTSCNRSPANQLDLLLDQIPCEAALKRKSEAPVPLCQDEASMGWGVPFVRLVRPGAGR